MMFPADRGEPGRPLGRLTTMGWGWFFGIIGGLIIWLGFSIDNRDTGGSW